jgi:hypothetical protein
LQAAKAEGAPLQRQVFAEGDRRAGSGLRRIGLVARQKGKLDYVCGFSHP